MNVISQDVISTLLESDETKNHVAGLVKAIAPMFVGAGLGITVPFLSPLIIVSSIMLVRYITKD